MNRRKFLAGSAAANAMLSTAPRVKAAASDRPAILGGTPARRNPFPSWPITDEQEEKAILSVLRSGKWNRGMGQVVSRFEESYSKLMGSQRCLATANGTSALLVTLNTMGIGPGDEVIVPPYTFVATINAILQVGALPVFVDSDGETFQIDARKIEAKIPPVRPRSCRSAGPCNSERRFSTP